jgi:hypothetical protein
MANSNSQYSWRQGPGGLRYDPSMPEWLKRQFVWQDGGEGGNGQWVLPEAARDEEGNELMLADDRGDIVANGESVLQEGKTARWIPGLGWAANIADTDSTGKFERRQRRGKIIAGTIIGGSALAGMALAGAGGAGAAGGAGGSSGLAATVPADLALSGGAVAPGYTLAEIPAITGAGGTAAGGGGLAGLGAASSGGGGGLAASVPADLALSTGGAGASTALDAMPAIQQAGGGSSMLSQAYNAAGGAQGIARMGMGLAGLGAAASGDGGGNGGETDPQNIIEQMANANRVDHNTPIGNRRWAKDPATGRWTVTDSMSPVEQENFGNVQTLNAGVTQAARDRLAALLAQPRRRYDRPYGT